MSLKSILRPISFTTLFTLLVVLRIDFFFNLFLALEDSKKELLVFAGGSNPSEKFDFEHNTTCPLAAYPTDQENVAYGTFSQPSITTLNSRVECS